MNRRLILLLSLTANVVLAGLIISSLAGSKSSSSTPEPPAHSASSISIDHTGDHSALAPGLHRLNETLWSRFDSDDLMTLAQRLREAGFPSRAIRRIIWNLNSARGEIARAAVQGKRADTPYWKNTPYLPDDPARRRKVQEINQQTAQVYMKLRTDPEGIADDDEFASYMRERYGDLPTVKLQQAAKITGDYWEMRNAITTSARKANPGGELTSSDKEKLALLTAEEERDIRQSLSPEEFAEFRYRSSPTADRLRDYLEVFRPNEQEYKTIFDLQQAIDARFNISIYEREPKDKQAYQAAMSALGPQLEAALGEERYAEYLLAMDQTNNKLKRIVARLELPLTTVNTLTAVQSDISQRADAVRKDASLSASDRSAQLAQLAQEAQSRLTATLGSRGYEAYEQVKGSWLGALKESSAR